MGEIADWYLEKMMFPFDEDEELEGYDREPRPVKCKHCGTTHVYWAPVPDLGSDQYRLFNSGTNTQHFCNVVSDDEFDDLT